MQPKARPEQELPFICGSMSQLSLSNQRSARVNKVWLFCGTWSDDFATFRLRPRVNESLRMGQGRGNLGHIDCGAEVFRVINSFWISNGLKRGKSKQSSLIYDGMLALIKEVSLRNRDELLGLIYNAMFAFFKDVSLRKRYELLDLIVDQINRIWGDSGFSGNFEEYDWLLEHYGVTEEEDNTYLDILEYRLDNGFTELSSVYMLDADEQARIMEFIHDDVAVCAFLAALLQKYKSNSVLYTH